MRSIIPAPRATVGQWIREAGEPSRCSRRPSISVSAGGDQRRAGVGGHALAAAGGRAHLADARQHEHLVVVAAGQHALGEPERVAQDERGRGQHAPAAAAERHFRAYARAGAARR